MDQVQHWLGTLPPVLVYLIVAAVIGAENLGILVPGEIALMSAALLAASSHSTVSIGWVALAASTGAIVGGSLGYAFGRRGGRKLLERLGRRFPRHLGPAQLVQAERMFARWGTWTVFFGRFIALLRVLACLLAGSLKVPYPKFLLANATGGIIWATGTAYLIWALGRAAERWLNEFSWIALAVGVAIGIATTLLLRHRANRSLRANR
jgi:membrane protein DedA with SNARE-associated domain